MHNDPNNLQDPLVFQALKGEEARQQSQIELIASENIVSNAVLAALGHKLTNKTLEGYPGNRFHGGAEFADVIEQAAIDRACQLFGCAYANVQPIPAPRPTRRYFSQPSNPETGFLVWIWPRVDILVTAPSPICRVAGLMLIITWLRKKPA